MGPNNRIPGELYREITDISNAFRRASFEEEFPPLQEESNIENMNAKILKRHLTKPERDILHKPLPDWEETSKGEVCKNACSLDISDIFSKKLKKN